MFKDFAEQKENVDAVNQIIDLQKSIMEKWKLTSRIKDIIDQSVKIPNATVGKPYTAKIDFNALNWKDLSYTGIESLEEYGLSYDSDTGEISGTPIKSGDFKLQFQFRIKSEADNSALNIKPLAFVVNPDPKSLWKYIPSDEGKDEAWKQANYWKPDTAEDFQPLLDKHVVVASRRGRSHANVGSFRDDDFAFKEITGSGWGVVAVSDGAGSSKFSRKGSQLACNTIIEYFEGKLTPELSAEFEALAKNSQKESAGKDLTSEAMPVVEPVVEMTTGSPPAGEPAPDSTVPPPTDKTEVKEPVTETAGQKINKFIYNLMGNAARTVYKTLEEFGKANNITLKELHSTLVFAAIKRYDFGYVILTFGVGDCPIGLMNKAGTEVKLMNWLDVGEFGGGTRFITMADIFTSDKFATRLGFKVIDDFSYLFLMTDGIYDPKFVVEANLEKLEKWKEFVADLQGSNEDKAKVNFDPKNKDMAKELGTWMDFWSPGNHDDRTLAIVF